MSMRKYWFKAKKYGWGWGLPQTWQGWTVFLLYFYFVLPLFVSIRNATTAQMVFGITVQIILMTILLVVICFITGEKPRWRWGGKRT